jgi:hypothetical protein
MLEDKMQSKRRDVRATNESLCRFLRRERRGMDLKYGVGARRTMLNNAAGEAVVADRFAC